MTTRKLRKEGLAASPSNFYLTDFITLVALNIEQAYIQAGVEDYDPKDIMEQATAYAASVAGADPDGPGFTLTAEFDPTPDHPSYKKFMQDKYR